MDVNKRKSPWHDKEKQSCLKVNPKGDIIKVTQSKYGNNVFDNLVFDVNTQLVVGEEKKGKVIPLTLTGIEKCNKHRLKFVIPTNLDEDKDVKDCDEILLDEVKLLMNESKIEEVEEEELEEEKIEEVEEEELE